jgi:hypothetical protein
LFYDLGELTVQTYSKVLPPSNCWFANKEKCYNYFYLSLFLRDIVLLNIRSGMRTNGVMTLQNSKRQSKEDAIFMFNEDQYKGRVMILFLIQSIKEPISHNDL